MHVYVAGRATSRMAQDITLFVSTVIMLLFLAILSTGVREDNRRVSWLIVSPTVTEVLRHVVLSVAVVAVRTSPAVES